MSELHEAQAAQGMLKAQPLDGCIQVGRPLDLNLETGGCVNACTGSGRYGQRAGIVERLGPWRSVVMLQCPDQMGAATPSWSQ